MAVVFLLYKQQPQQPQQQQEQKISFARNLDSARMPL